MCGTGRSPWRSPCIPHHALPLQAIRSHWGLCPQQLERLCTGRCSHTRSAEWKGGRVKPCFWKRGQADTQGCWQEGGLVRMEMKNQTTNGFCNKFSFRVGKPHSKPGPGLNAAFIPKAHKHVRVGELGFSFPHPGTCSAGPGAAAAAGGARAKQCTGLPAAPRVPQLSVSKRLR